MKRYLLALTAAIITAGSCLYAQKNENQTLLNAALHGWEYEVRAGISIGGSSPLPLPAEIDQMVRGRKEMGTDHRTETGK